MPVIVTYLCGHTEDIEDNPERPMWMGTIDYSRVLCGPCNRDALDAIESGPCPPHSGPCPECGRCYKCGEK